MKHSKTETKKTVGDGILELRPIAYMHSDFPEKFGIPRQPGLVPELTSVVEFEPEYGTEDFLKGLWPGFSHIWLVWGFSANASSGSRATVRPPRLGGNERLGVWATRSPFRPNPVGLSCVKIREVYRGEKGLCILVEGADLMDGTPIYDIKPYVPLTDCRTEAVGGFTDTVAWKELQVDFPEGLLAVVPEAKRTALIGVLAQDPRPAYQEDPDREYGITFAGVNVRFKVREGILTVLNCSQDDLA